MISAEQWIRALDLKPLPGEGGLYAEPYRSRESVAASHLPGRFGGDRTFSTAIYYLLQGKQVSPFHRIRQDEIWHYYYGSALTLHTLSPDGVHTEHFLGTDPAHRRLPQVVIPAGWWFAGAVDDASSYTLVGCTVAPGFEFADIELAARPNLLAAYPQHRQLIERFSR